MADGIGGGRLSESYGHRSRGDYWLSSRIVGGLDWIVAGDYVLLRFASESSPFGANYAQTRIIWSVLRGIGAGARLSLAWTAGAGSIPTLSVCDIGGIGRLMRFSIPAVSI